MKNNKTDQKNRVNKPAKLQSISLEQLNQVSGSTQDPCPDCPEK